VAARIRRELGIEVDTIRSSYGEYKVLVDGALVVDGGALVILGVMPSARKVVAAVRERLAAPEHRAAEARMGANTPSGG
jgi:hypothetical protein